MTGELLHLISLATITAMLAAVLLIAWRSFGRPWHALLWAIAFALATGEWIAYLAMRLTVENHAAAYAGIAAMSCLSNGLIAMGFVKRSRPAASLTLLFLTAIAAAPLTGLLTLAYPGIAVRDAVWLTFGGIMLLISASFVARPGTPANMPERVTVLILATGAIINFATAALAMGPGRVGTGGSLELYRITLALLYPLTLIGVGLFAVFLVAADLAETMRRAATRDPLTGILNRRGFEGAAERTFRNALRLRLPLAIAVADIDNFKVINDRFGHDAGDRALKHFATELERLLRRGDLVGRVGGEEFALLLVGARAEQAMVIVERLRADIAAIAVEGDDQIRLTASFGITGLRPDDTSLATLLSRADRALYRSKLDGRDRVTSADDPGTPPEPPTPA